jgi:hypothetical protein
MSEISISATDLETFHAKLKDGLSDNQKKLLDAILRIAWQVTAEEESLSQGFDCSFTPNEAKLLLAYKQPSQTEVDPDVTVLFPRMIEARLIK